MALTDNLLAFYKLSDLTDSSGNNRTLTNNGNVSFASGKIGNAAGFDGSNTLSKDRFTPFGSNDFTISMFVKDINTNGYYKMFFSTRPDGQETSDAFSFGLTPSSTFLFYDGNLTDTGFAFTENEWYHVSFVNSSGSLTFYINGSLVGSASQNAAYANSFFYIGNNASGIELFNGSLDAVGIWNRALSESEVTELYNNGTGLELDGGNGGGGGGNPTLVKMEAPIKFFGKVKFGA